MMIKTDSKTDAPHTPLPWRADHFEDDVAGILDSNGVQIGECVQRDHEHSAEANAEFIVRAVNAHDALMDAAKAMRFIFNKGLNRTCDLEWNEAAGKVYAALALGEGEKEQCAQATE